MATSNISWTMYSPLEDETSVLDPLGFDYCAQLLGNVVLPGFTTRTSRARYYSMVAYGVYICNEYLKKSNVVSRDREKDFFEVFKLYEKYWARGIVEFYNGDLRERDGKEREMRGKRGAIKAYNDGVETLDYQFLTRQIELGGLGAYRSSMESLELLKSDLTLTHNGLKLAQSFIPVSGYDEMILEAIKTGRIIKKRAGRRPTLRLFGSYTCLDASKEEVAGWQYRTKNANENDLLKKCILDSSDNVVANTLIYNNRYDEVSMEAEAKDANVAIVRNPMEIINEIAGCKPKTEEEAKVINGFRTILAFEEFAVIVNNIWCAIIRTAKDKMGRLAIEEAVKASEDYLYVLSDGKYIDKLLEQTAYSYIRNGLHGVSLNGMLTRFQNMSNGNYGDFIRELVKYHKSVMSKRNSGTWITIEGDELLVTSGYDYPKKTEGAEYLHGYKINNIISMIEDTGWKPNGEEY